MINTAKQLKDLIRNLAKKDSDEELYDGAFFRADCPVGVQG